MKKIKLNLDRLRVESFATGRSSRDGTVQAFSGDQIVYESDWNPNQCGPWGPPTGAYAGCGGGPTGFAQSCADMTCIHGC